MTNYNLKQEIKSLGMTQKEFAQYLQIGEQTVGQWVRGVVPTPHWAKLLITLLYNENKFKEIRKLLKEVL